jgi:alpha-tubulin suppressor-like RCC1 family protein/fibronectin type 3 domain-containing protein
MRKLLILTILLCAVIGGLFTSIPQWTVNAVATVTPQIDGGYAHTIALKNDGTVWTWGNNSYGQLGDGTTTLSNRPQMIANISGVKVVAAGTYHNLVLKNDGTVWAWGSNGSGQLGDGTYTTRKVPQPVANLSNVKAIAAGESFSAVLKEDGTVWTWGGNSYGQLGDGTNTARTTPVQASISDVISIAAGNSHLVALKTDGTVWAWGDNSSGQLGDNSLNNRNYPVRTRKSNDIRTTKVACGINTSYYINSSGLLYAWGNNSQGQIGDGYTTNRTAPVLVSLQSKIIDIAGGALFAVALREDRTVWAWGRNDYGQLGDGTNVNKTTPLQISGLSGVTAVGCGTFHSMAWLNDGTVFAWGNNSWGQLGDGTTTERKTPGQVPNLDLSPPPAVPANLAATAGNGKVTLTWDSTLATEYYNVKRATTAGGPYTTVATNVIITTFEDITVSNGTGYFYVVTAVNNIGESGTSAEATAVPNCPPPSAPANLTAAAGDAKAILNWNGASGADFYCIKRATTPGGPYTTVAVNVSGTTYDDITVANGITYYYVVTAFNTGGESETSNEAPVTPYNPRPSTPANLVALYGYGKVTLTWNTATTADYYNVKRATIPGGPYTVISANITVTSYDDATVVNGVTYYYIVTASNTFGESGASNETPITDPRPLNPAGLIAAAGDSKVNLYWTAAMGAEYYNIKRAETAAGPYATIATGITTTTYSDIQAMNSATYFYVVTASNIYGESGTTNEETATPQKLIIMPQIIGGYGHSLALKEDGSVWSWGYNDYGQLGDGTNTNSNVPIMIAGINGVKAVSTGHSHCLALKIDGSVWAWGANYNYQLGDGSTTPRNIPTQVANLSNIRAAAAGSHHSVALKEDGTVWVWGSNSSGQLGDGTTTDRTTPVQVPGLNDIVSVAATGDFTIALKKDGSVYTWGNNYYGQLGDGSAGNRTKPYRVNISGVKFIASGYDTAYAIKNDGFLWAWGHNNYGQIGDWTTYDRYLPVKVGNLANVTTVSAPGDFALAVTEGGTLWSWGSNTYGQLGDGTINWKNSPAQITSLSNVVIVGSGYHHSLAVKDDGSVFAWGDNCYGQLGDGTATAHKTPIQVAGVYLLKIPSVPANLTATPGNARVTLNWNAALGAEYYNVKRAETAGGPYTIIAANLTTATYDDTTAANGTTYYYVVSALNASGESGVSNQASATPYIQIPLTPANLTASPGNAQVTLNWSPATGADFYKVKKATVAGGPYTTIAADVSGTAFEDTAVTNGTTYYYIVTAVNGGGESGASNQVSATPYFPVPFIPTGLTAAAGNAKVTLNWNAASGADSYNVKKATVAGGPYTTISTGLTVTAFEDTTVTNGTPYYYRVTASNAGGESGASNEVSATPYDPKPASPTGLAATASNGKVTLSWGNASGAEYYSVKRAIISSGPYTTIAYVYVTNFADTTVSNETKYFYIVTATNAYGESGTSGETSATPREVVITPQIAGGSGHSIALKDDGTVWVWGDNTYGQLGDGTNNSTNLPKLLLTIHEIKAVAAGESHSLALKTDGTVWAWGQNSQLYQLGDGTVIDRNTPVQVTGLYHVKGIAAARSHSIALKEDGTVWVWGMNSLGQLGDGTDISRSTPVKVPGLSNIVSIAAAGNFNIALRSDGTVWTWGDNQYGVLGDGTDIDRHTPVQAGISGAKAVTCSYYNAYAVKNDGTLWAWGYNEHGQVGDGTTITRYSPVLVHGIENVASISAGINFAVALKKDGTLWGWGSNYFGQIGDATYTDRFIPARNNDLVNVFRISCGYSHSLAIKIDGSVFAWGSNSKGQLGDGSTVLRNSRSQALNLFLSTKPLPPTNLSARAGNAKVALEWDPASGAAFYNLKRSQTVGGPYSTIAAYLNGTNYEDTAVTNGTNYYYIVTSGNGVIESGASNEVSAIPNINPPSAPANLAAVSGNANVTLGWDAVTGSDYYNVKRATTVGGPYATIATHLTVRTYNDLTVTNGITYYYVVTAVNAGGESGPSNEAVATPNIDPPAAPTNLIAVAGSGMTIILNWNAVTGATSYTVKRQGRAGGPYATIATNISGTTFQDTNVPYGVTYYYVVTAVNAGGEGGTSNEASATL